ncbi:MAG: hypothetical protein NW223_10925 [Hyphomicrobiaceae bacterium]|nr:hypothetical protein [Hyphomicrobiaceae bacterium]
MPLHLPNPLGIAGGVMVAGMLAAQVALADVRPTLQGLDAARVLVQAETRQPARRGLKGSAQAPAPPAAPAAKAPAPATPAASPGAPKDYVRTPAQEYEDCIKLWDAGTHMTRAEWAATCRRIQNRLSTIGQQSSQISPGPRRAR